jgi:methionyl-tRNA formyltransferase
MRLVLAGTPAAALPTLDALARSRHDLLAVVTRPDAPAGRGRRLAPSPVARRAADLGVPALKPDHPRDTGFLAELRALAPDCCPVVAYGAILPQSALDVPGHGWVNLHFSVLPAWRGAAPVQHALWAGDEVTGATTFRIIQELDAGPVYGVMTEPIRPDDTAGSLLERLAVGGAGLMVRTMDGIDDGSLEPVAQPAAGVSLAPKVTVADAEVDWTEPAFAVDRRIRACTPAPGAWSSYQGRRLTLGPVRIETTEGSLEAGRVVVGKQVVHVGTGTHPVALGRVTAPGRRSMPAADWARGARLGTGARLGDAG